MQQTFRAYLLDENGKITRGHWIEAVTEREALEKAKKLCTDESLQVELWQGASRVGVDHCG